MVQSNTTKSLTLVAIILIQSAMGFHTGGRLSQNVYIQPKSTRVAPTVMASDEKGQFGSWSFTNALGTAAIVASISLAAPFINPSPAVAVADKRIVAEIPTSGLVFKDTLNVEAFTDPKVEGVTLYISDFTRPITERLKKDFFSDPASSSITCTRTGPMKIVKPLDQSPAGEDVFTEAKNLFFKSVKVKRVYDAETDTVIYVSYSEKIFKDDKGKNASQYKSSICALHVE